jgi:glycosyltransferase involved in cell wall biosynthesis
VRGDEPARGSPVLVIVVNEARFFLTHRLPLADAAHGAGYAVHIAVPRRSDGFGDLAAHAASNGLVLHDIPLDRRGMNPASEARLLTRLLGLYRRLRPAVVHHVTVKPVLYGSLAARAARVPRVVNAVAGLGYLHLARGWRARAARAAVRRLYRAAFDAPGVRVVFQNGDDRAAFVGAGLVPAPRAVLVRGGSGVDLARFRVRPAPDGAPIVMLPARMLWDKGVGEFVEAARLLRARGLGARFVLVGDTDVNRAAVPRARLAGWQAEGVVEWWGRRDDMPEVLAAASVVVLPSYREGCPKVLLEAAACGRAIVTTDVAGCRDVVTPEREGLLVPARDAAALADAIAALVTDAPRRAACAAAARRRAEAEFGVGRVVAAHLALYAGGEAAA